MRATENAAPDANLARTGIAGFDEILGGGFPVTNVILVQGRTGSGKTLLGVEFIYRGALQFDEPGIIILFETSPDKLIRDCAAFNWNLRELREKQKIEIIFTSPEVLEQELRSPESLLLERAAQMGARRIFIDGIGLLNSMAPQARGKLPPMKCFRQMLQQLTESFLRANLTAMLSHEIGSHHRFSDTLDEAGFVADTIVQLGQHCERRCASRSVEIVKSRGHRYDDGQHTFRIASGSGLEVFRRVQAPLYLPAVPPASPIRRSATGVEALDALIGGGLYDGSTNMVVGVSGAGKTVLGTQLLHEATVRYSRKALLISLEEEPAQIVRDSREIGLDLQPLIDNGSLHVLFENPQELDIDGHYSRITQIVELYGIERLVIDGTTSYSNAVGNEKGYRDFFSALVNFSKSRLITCFFNCDTPEFLGLSRLSPEFPIASIVDNIILLSLVEIRSSLRRCITVVKARGSRHELDSREFRIGRGGIDLLPVDADSSEAFPQYSGILSRAPTRERLPLTNSGTMAECVGTD